MCAAFDTPLAKIRSDRMIDRSAWRSFIPVSFVRECSSQSQCHNKRSCYLNGYLADKCRLDHVSQNIFLLAA